MVRPQDVAVHHRREPSGDIHNMKSPENGNGTRAVEPSETDSDVGDGYTNWVEEV